MRGTAGKKIFIFSGEFSRKLASRIGSPRTRYRGFLQSGGASAPVEATTSFEIIRHIRCALRLPYSLLHGSFRLRLTPRAPRCFSRFGIGLPSRSSIPPRLARQAPSRYIPLSVRTEPGPRLTYSPLAIKPPRAPSPGRHGGN